MGEVYRAHDGRLDREVVIKVLPAEVADDADRLRRFELEAKAISALNHPHIVTIYELGRSEHGPYLVLERIQGRSLRELLRQRPLPVKRILTLGAQIAEGLAEAHAHGIVHRDLKPDNVMVTEAGLAKILDFGLAKRVDRELEASQVTTPGTSTATGVILGTAGYLSPEQAAGRPADFRSDQFALGLLIYELCTSQRPFRRATAAESLAAAIREEPEPLRSRRPDLPPQLGWIVERCLAKDPDDRFASTLDLARDLADLRDHLAELGTRAHEDQPVSGRLRGLRLATIIAVAAAGVAVGYLISVARRGGSTGRPSWAPTVERLTQLPGVESEPTMSPDGKSVVYVRQGHLWSQRVGGSNAVDLTPDLEASFAPAFSPDGESLAFNAERDGGGIFVMGATGEDLRRVTSGGFYPAWTPDGRELVFSSSAASFYGGVPEPGLHAVEIATGSIRGLCECVALNPDVSPDGRRVAFLSYGAREGGQRDLWTVPLAGLAPGEAPLRLTDDAAVDWDPRWSPDGSAIEFLSSRGGTPNLWRLPVDEASGRARGSASPLPLPAAFVRSSHASGDGRTRVFEGYSRRTVLLRREFDPDEAAFLSEPREALQLGDAVFGLYGTAPFSPDGRWIAVQGGPTLDDLVLLALDGSAVRTLMHGPFRVRQAAWSPDGKTIAFGYDRGGKYEIWGIGVDGGNLRQLITTSSPLLGPIWSPDGASLLASELGGEVVIQRLADPPDRVERLPRLPDGSAPAGALWLRSGQIAAVGRGALWLWSSAEGVYRLLVEPFGQSDSWDVVELSEGRWLVIAERLVAENESGQVSGAEAGRPRESVEFRLIDPRSGDSQLLWEMPGGYRPGLGLDPSQRSLWINRWQEESDLWIARIPGETR